MEFPFRGCRIFISFWFTVIMAVSAVLDSSGAVTCGLLAAIIHELGHVLEMARQKSLPRQIRFGLFNVDIVDFCREQRTYQQDIKILLAGPLANFLTAVLCLPFFFLLPYAWVGLFLSANLVVGFFNLQPVVTLDGGAALYAFFSAKKGEERASFLVNVISFLVLIPMAAAGFFLLLRNPYNFSLLLISLYLMGVLVLQKTDFF